MVDTPNISRRAFILGAVGGASLIGTSGYAYARYSGSIFDSNENSIQFRQLRGTNLSDKPATLTVTVRDDGEHYYDRTYELEAAEDDDGTVQSISGPWLKESGKFSVHAEMEDEELTLENSVIIDQLDELGEGNDCADIMITITDERTLESTISDSDEC